jgi:hypothetical protein
MTREPRRLANVCPWQQARGAQRKKKETRMDGFTYSMCKSGPDVRPDEVESHRLAIEVIILWDSNVVHVSHLTPPRPFHVGEEVGGKFGCDYFIPGETLGTTRAPIVVCEGPRAALVILPRSRGHVDVPGHRRVSFAELISSGRARPSAEMSGAYEYELASNARARMELEGSSLVFEVGAMNAGKRVPAGCSPRRNLTRCSTRACRVCCMWGWSPRSRASCRACRATTARRSIAIGS